MCDRFGVGYIKALSEGQHALYAPVHVFILLILTLTLEAVLKVRHVSGEAESLRKCDSL